MVDGEATMRVQVSRVSDHWEHPRTPPVGGAVEVEATGRLRRTFATAAEGEARYPAETFLTDKNGVYNPTPETIWVVDVTPAGLVDLLAKLGETIVSPAGWSHCDYDPDDGIAFHARIYDSYAE
ncbi:MAG: hypothetical protein ACRBK7_14450 [Acidimicrobiales bacterium]